MSKPGISAAPRKPLRFEALEPRILFDAAPEVAVAVSSGLTIADDQFINDDITFQIDFSNTGDDTGYAPYVDFIAPAEMEIKSVTVYGGPGQNPADLSTVPIGRIAADGQLVDADTGVPVNHPMFLSSIGAPTADYFGGAGSGTPPVFYDVIANPGYVGQLVYSVELPFGSFTPDNFPASIFVTAGLDTANGILPNQDYAITAFGGFALGEDPLDNPGTVGSPDDAPVFGASSTQTVHPYVVNLLKTASVYEQDGPYTGEMPSGPNFPVTYTLRVNIAAGETLENLVITDLLPPDLAYTGNLDVSFGAGTSGPRNVTIVSEPLLNTDQLTGTPAGQNTLRIEIDSVTGIDPNAGASITVTYTAFAAYVEPDGTPVIDPVTGIDNPVFQYNDAMVVGLWNGNAVLDNAGPVTGSDPDGIMGPVETDYRLKEHSIAVQKSVGFAAGGDRDVIGAVNRGDVLEYLVNFQISDYFAFTDVVVDDLLGDGQSFLPGDGSIADALDMVPVLRFQMDGATIEVDFDPANYSWTVNPDGTTEIQFDVYRQLVDSGFVADGEALRGGFIPETGILPAELGTHNGGATTGSITFRALVRNAFVEGGNPEISQGDHLGNEVLITGLNRDITTFAPLVAVTDDSSAGVSLPVGAPDKVVHSVFSHGAIRPYVPGSTTVTPGDLVTYRINYTLPLTDFENLSFTDFLPLPIFDVASIDDSQIHAYDPALAYTTAGRISWGPGDTFVGSQGPGVIGDGGIDDTAGYNLTADQLSISIDKSTFASSNGFVVNIGSYHPGEGNPSVTTTLELLVTVPVIDAKYADRLFFTNQVASAEQNTPGAVSAADEIAQILLVQPDLSVTKGVAAVTNPNGTFSAPLGPAGVTFNAPGSPAAFSGTIHSDGLAAQSIDANLANVDAGDLVTFLAVVENTGTSPFGAFDVTLLDTVPAGFEIPAGGPNLRVTDGAGNAIAFVGDLFATPLELIDPAIDQGAIAGYDPTSGANVIVIAYDLVLATSVNALETLENNVEVLTYAASEGGANQTSPGTLVDSAEVRTASAGAAKVFISSSHVDDNNQEANRHVAIGEVVTYEVTYTLPEGTMQNVRLTDTLPNGMAFVGIDSIVVSPALSSPDGDLAGDLVGYFSGNGRTLSLGYGAAGSAGLGTLVNGDTDNDVAETITVTYRAVVLNASANQIGNNRNNTAEVRWEVGGSDEYVRSNVSVRVVEPNLTTTKSVVGAVSTVEGAEEITYRIRIQNNAGANRSEAYNVTLSDLLPAEVSYVAGSVSWTGGVEPDGGSLQFLPASGPEGEIVASWARLGVGEFSEIEVTVRIDDGLPAGSVIGNTATARYTSLPGSPGDPEYTGFDPASGNPALAFGTGPLNVNLNPTASVYNIAHERTGNPSDPGGSVNNYVQNGDVSVTVLSPVGIEKAVVTTSEPHTANDASSAGAVTGAIGEVVRYEVRIRLPQATSTDLQLVDTLHPGLLWIDAAANNLEIGFEGFDDPANLVASSPLLPAADGGFHALDPSLVGFDAASNRVTFSLGDLTNLETDPEPEFVVIRYNAIVRNDGSVSRGDVLTNTVQLRENGADIGGTLTQSLTVVEPVLSIAKSDGGVTTADAGDLISYTLTVSASGAANTATAFDLLVTDSVPDSLEIVGGTASVVGLPAGSSIVSTSVAGQDIAIAIDRLDPGESFQIVFTARVRDTGPDIVRAGETIVNAATLAYSSLPGDGTPDGAAGNATGNEAGAPGSPSGERFYSSSGSDSFATPAPVISKTLADPSLTTFTIGETVEYVIQLTIPEGRTGGPLAYVLDTIDPGFGFVPGSFSVSLGPGISVGAVGPLDESNAAFFTHTDPGDAYAETLQLDFGHLDYQNASASDGLASGTVEIRYRLVVENILANQRGDQLNNVASLHYSAADPATTRTANDADDTNTIVTVVEPRVDAAKTVENLTSPQAGGVVSYRVALTHPGGPLNPLYDTPAYDLTFVDDLPAHLTLQTGTFTALLNGTVDVSHWFTVTATGIVDAGTGDIDLMPGDEIVLAYDAVIDIAVTDGLQLVNAVDVEWTSLDGDVAGQRTGDSNPFTPADPSSPNQYESNASVVSTIDLTPFYGLTKSVHATSEAHTGSAAGTSPTIEDLVVGEMVTYEIVAQIARGTSHGVVIEDILDLSQGILDIRDVRIEIGAALSLTVPAPALGDTNSDGYLDQVLLNFGTVVNDPALSGGLADEQIRIYIDAVVVNVAANQAGDVVRNTARFTVLEDTDGNGAADNAVVRESFVDVEIVEPVVTVAKSVTSVPANPVAGDTVAYQIVVANDSGVDAFDLAFADALPPLLELQTGTFSATRASDGADLSALFTVTASGIVLNDNTFDLADGDSVTLAYEAEILVAVTDGQRLVNEAGVQWTSIDGDANADQRTGDGTGPNDYARDDSETVTANLTPFYGLTKTIQSTSEAHTGSAAGTDPVIEDLVVGERVTYQIVASFGRGTSHGVVIEDILALDEGVLDIREVRVELGGSILATIPAPTLTDSDGDGYIDRALLDFGTVVNNATGPLGADPDAEQIRIYIDAVVVNVAANQAGDVVRNTARFTVLEDTDGNGAADNAVVRESFVDVEIVEPTLSLAKTITAVPADATAGDSVAYQLVIENTGEIDAFDLSFSDALPAQMSLDAGTFTAVRLSDGADVSAFFVVTASGIVQAPDGFDLAAGDRITLAYEATILATVTDGLALVNEADLAWTSLSGGANPDQRTGDGAGPNDYNDDDSQTVTANLSPVYGFTKSVHATSEAHTGSAAGTDPLIEDLVIGETVTYELVAQMGRGTTHGVVIEDWLDFTQGVLDIRDVRIEFGAAIGLTMPTPVYTDSNGDGYIDQVLLDFGTVINDPALSGGLADEQVRVYIDAVVVNVLANQAGDVVRNTARLTVLEDTDGNGAADNLVAREGFVDVEIVEPAVTATKTIPVLPASPDAADRVGYQVVIANTSDTDAFDIILLDALPPKMTLDPASFAAVRASDGADVSAFFALQGLGSGDESITQAGGGFALAAGDSITVTYQGVILPSIMDGERQTNRVAIEWSSIAGANADKRSGDGDFDNPADPSNPNQYEDDSSTTFAASLTGYAFTKTIVATSADHTGTAGGADPDITDLAIGETVTYALTATFGEGTTPFVTIADAFDISQGVLAIEAVSIVGGANMSSSQGSFADLVPVLVDSNGDGYFDQLTIDLGSVVNTGADGTHPDPASAQIVVHVTARVVNVVENRAGDLIENTATFTYRDDQNGDGVVNEDDDPTVLAAGAFVELLEPDLSIAKSVDNPTPKLGETLTYTLRVTNAINTHTTDAFSLSVLDRLPTGLTLQPGSVSLVHVTAAANPSAIVANTSDPQNLRLVIDRLDEGAVIEIVYEALVTEDILYFDAVLPNLVDLEWSSLPGGDPAARGGDGDPDSVADSATQPNFYESTSGASVEVHQPDLAVTKVLDADEILPGQTLVYTLEITNQGRATALTVGIEDDISHFLANGFDFVDASDGGTLDSGIVTWSLPDLAVGASQSVTLTLRAPAVIPAALERIDNTVVATHLDIDPTPEDNEDRTDTPIIAVPDLVVSKTDGLDHTTVGDHITYTITYDNVGDQMASGVVIRDTLPSGVRFVSASHGGKHNGNSSGGGTVEWHFPLLAPGGGSSVTVTVEVLQTQFRTALLHNVVTIKDDGRGGADPTPENNRDTDDTIAERRFQFDLSQNFLFDRGNLSQLRHDHGWGRGTESRLATVLATHMNSGLAQPGSTITLEVFNHRGERIAEQSVVADAGGNWLASFATDKIHDQPSRIVMKQTWSTANLGDNSGYNFRTYFAPTFSSGTYYTEELSIWNVTGKRSATEVIDLYEASKDTLALDWNGTTYEFSSRGGLQSSSGN